MFITAKYAINFFLVCIFAFSIHNLQTNNQHHKFDLPGMQANKSQLIDTHTNCKHNLFDSTYNLFICTIQVKKKKTAKRF